MKQYIYGITAFIALSIAASSCSISYSFSGSSIDYTKVHSIAIKDFPNMSPLVYAPLSQKFNETLKDKYTRRTKLQITRDNGDMSLEGEITGYNMTPQAVKEDAYASQTRLTITVRARFVNKANSDNDFEKTFSAYQEFSNERTIDEVQDELCQIIIDEIVDQIFNETVANW
ncbi:MAG: LPS assembly lipoprotein LptE [Tannerella sp.]|jgi:vesicle coat complex subunit|nr:LPS assembly lipoprotein LptE [Tannerella sp.]